MALRFESIASDAVRRRLSSVVPANAAKPNVGHAFTSLTVRSSVLVVVHVH